MPNKLAICRCGGCGRTIMAYNFRGQGVLEQEIICGCNAKNVLQIVTNEKGETCLTRSTLMPIKPLSS
jgi:hypothetical protein